MLKSTLKMSALIVGALVLSSSAALAVSGDVDISKTLNTSALYSTGSKTYHACVVADVSVANVGVKVDLVDASGHSMLSSGGTPAQIQAGAVFELTPGAGETYSGFARCRVVVYNGNADEIRANVAVIYNTGDHLVTLAVSEAR